jgi:hypothetical protein
MRTKALFFILALATCTTITLLLPLKAHACSCGPPDTVRERLADSDAVFTGKVVGIDEDIFLRRPGWTAVRFDVTAIWKGPNQPQLVIYAGYSNDTGSMCEGKFQLGESYLVYAFKDKNVGVLDAGLGICSSYTGRLVDKEQDLRELGLPIAEGQQIGMPRAGIGSSMIWQLSSVVAAICIGVGLMLKLLARTSYYQRPYQLQYREQEGREEEVEAVLAEKSA